MKQNIDKLKAAPKNPRTIDDQALAGLGYSMEQFGDLSGIVFNERTGHLVAGHQRIKALHAAGAKSWERNGAGGSIQDPRTGERFPVRIVKWDDATEMLANIAANNPELQGEFTPDLLKELAALQADARYAALALDRLAEQAEEDLGADDTETKDDAAPEKPKKPISKRGDLWKLGEHRLLCGDATDAADVGRLMQDDRALLMATDPPYGVAYTDDARVAAERAHVRPQRMPKWADGIDNDEKTGADIQPFLEACFRAAVDLALEKSAAWYLWHAHLTQAFFAAAAANLVLHRQIIWVKPSLLFGFGDYHWRHELAFYGWVQGHRPKFYGERNQTTIWEIKNETANANRVHPTQKPVEIFAIPMRNHTRAGGACYEPFSGSGSQISAGEQLGRRVRACEIDPGYVDVAVERWQALTGRKATRKRA